MKRFYKLVIVAPRPDSHIEIHLDHRPVKLPSGLILTAPNIALATAVQAEWAAQDQIIKPDTMPITQILTTAQDSVRLHRVTMTRTVLAYLDTDLLCYRAATPPQIAARQALLWDPWLEWFTKEFGVCLRTTQDLQVIEQPVAAYQAMSKMIEELDDLRFTIFQLIVAAGASIALGAAFIKGAASVEQLVAAFYAEENFKAEIYNADQYGLAPQEEKARAATLADLQATVFIRDHL